MVAVTEVVEVGDVLADYRHVPADSRSVPAHYYLVLQALALQMRGRHRNHKGKSNG